MTGVTKIGERRRQEILTAAAACFARRGFHQTTMPEICAEAGMSPGSVYRYFAGKDEIIAAIVEADQASTVAEIAALAHAPDALAALLGAFTDIAAGGGDPVAGALTLEIAAEATRNPRVAELVARYEASLIAALATVVRTGQARGEIDPELDPDLAAALLSALMDDIVVRTALPLGLDLGRYASFVEAMVRRMVRIPSVQAEQ